MIAGAPFKRVIVLDFETAWAADLGFSTQTNEQYIRDPRFKAWGLCWKDLEADGQAVWVRNAQLSAWCDSIDWSTTAVVAHNAQFDVSILSWIYGVKPCFIFDTLSMGRALRGVEVGNSLKKLAEALGLPPKGEELNLSKGYIDVLPFAVEEKLANYCRHDVFLCEQIFLNFIKGYPVKELKLIDMTLKMYVYPQLQLDKELLQEAIEQERETREGLLKKLGVDEKVLASNEKFAALLQTLGVEPPMKKSRTTGLPALALAKNDALFQALLNGDNEDVVLLCEARLKVKSTIERTRAQRFLDIANRGPLPVPLTYYGAGTGRWTASKGSSINMQNLRRARKNRRAILREAIMAPPGHVLGVGDLSQIEPRVLAWLADYNALLDIFRSGADPYAQFGAQMFGIPGLTKESHPDLRQSAKSALLGCGYGLGWASFAAQLLTGFLGADPVLYDKVFAKRLGVTYDDVQKFLGDPENEKKLAEIPHTCSLLELAIHCVAAKKIIDTYRDTAKPVTKFWWRLGDMIEECLYGGKETTYKCLVFRKEEIILPSGMPIKYPDLRRSVDDQGRVQWSYRNGDKREKLYPGKVANNVTQGSARVVMTDGMLRTSKRYFVAGTVHDEQIDIVPEAEAEEAKVWIREQMIVTPKYMPGIPLDADVGVHKRYGLAKQ